MSNEKQTAVDLMFQRAMFLLPMGSIDARQSLKETYQQAKEMHQEEITKAITFGQNNHTVMISHDLIIATEYYNETYGGNK